MRLADYNNIKGIRNLRKESICLVDILNYFRQIVNAPIFKALLTLLFFLREEVQGCCEDT